jgi:hypothetical protein
MELSVCELGLIVIIGIIIFILLKNILESKEGFRRLRNRRFRNNPYACAAECQTEGNRPVVITQPG